ncbi:MAG: hypothetical protein IIA49_09155 [Bacteroidetes bacterium]|nr:hypothetical protein [Bacteroidota bacterium]MCH7771168.1 hypothetical protein [Bacteroidota bacterium]
MRKILLLLLPIIIIGCEQTFDNIIETVQNNYQVSFVSPTDSITFRADDSLVTIVIGFTSSSKPGDVFCDIIASDQSKLNSSPFQLFDDNDNRYLNDFPLSKFYPNGIYNINYFVKNADETLQQVALASFKYNNGQDNEPPILCNLMMPDTLARSVIMIFSVDADDPNGLSDITNVFYELYKPDGTQVSNSQGITEFPLFDDGDTSLNGDLVESDGVYTVKLTFPVDVETGSWRFVFTAKDRGNLTSNIIIHFLEVI